MSKVICIDAGHGGTDPGAVNGRHKEAEAALGIANKIADKLKAKRASRRAHSNEGSSASAPTALRHFERSQGGCVHFDPLQ